MSRQNGASSALTLDKRSKIMLAVLAGVVLIAALYFLVLKKHGSSDNGANAPVAKPSASAPAAPKASATPKVTPTPATVVTADSTRDPFQALPEEAAATASASPSAAPSSSPSSSTPSSSPSSSAATGSHSVELLSITGDTASVSYDKGPGKTVKAGSTIATGMTVVKVDPDSIFISYNNKVYAIAPSQSVTF